MSVKTSEDLLSDDGISIDSDTDDDSDDLSAFGAGDGDTSIDLDEVEQRVYEALRDTLDDVRATPDDIDGLDLQHMLGVSPVEYYTDETGFTHIRAERPRESEDKQGTFMASSHALWGDKSDQQVETRIENAVAKLRSEGVFEVDADDDSEYENAKYFVVSNE